MGRITSPHQLEGAIRLGRIMGGGGVLSKKDADRLLDVGANAIELGSVSMLRPWRVQGIITHITRRFKW